MSTTDWPRPPIRPEDLPKIRELMMEEEFEELLARERDRASEKPRTPLGRWHLVWPMPTSAFAAA